MLVKFYFQNFIYNSVFKISLQSVKHLQCIQAYFEEYLDVKRVGSLYDRVS